MGAQVGMQTGGGEGVGGAEGELRWCYRSGPWLLESSKILVHVLACDLQSNNS